MKLNSSCGVVPFFVNKEGRIEVLMVKRRDSYAYLSFILGACVKEENAKKYTDYLTLDECRRIVKYSFDELVNDFYLTREKDEKLFVTRYKWMISAYKQCIKNIKELCNRRIQENDKNKDERNVRLMWGFPKGKPITNSNESQYDTAMREFSEECNLQSDFFEEHQIKKTYEKFEHVQVGEDNGIAYTTNYFPIEFHSKFEIRYTFFKNCIRHFSVSNETLDAMWVNLEEERGKKIPENLYNEIIKVIKR
jgi:8-oxo-dGTP pyrophosphatase MutT (NUDIX family)